MDNNNIMHRWIYFVRQATVEQTRGYRLECEQERYFFALTFPAGSKKVERRIYHK